MNKFLIVGGILGATAGAALAQDVVPNLGSAENYSVFGLGNTQMTMSSGNTNVFGNVAVGPNSTLNFSGGGIITGNLTVDPSSTTTITGGSTVTGITSTASLASAAQAAINASQVAANDAATSMLSSINGSTTLTATSPVSVFDVSGNIQEQGGSKLTLSGSANSYVIVNVTGGMTLGGGSQMVLTGGLTANHVLWNFEGSGQDINFNGNSTVEGTILAVDRNITVSGGVVNGAVIGAEDGQLKLQSGPKIHGQPVPEPASLLMLGIGAVALLRRKRNTKNE